MIEISGIGWQLFSRAFGNYSFFETTYVCVLNPSAYYSFVMTYACFYIYVLIVKVFGRTYVVQRALSVKAPKNKKERNLSRSLLSSRVLQTCGGLFDVSDSVTWAAVMDELTFDHFKRRQQDGGSTDGGTHPACVVCQTCRSACSSILLLTTNNSYVRVSFPAPTFNCQLNARLHFSDVGGYSDHDF
jgi:hypothetical protein